MNHIKVTDEEIIEASIKCTSAAQAAKSLGVYKTNQGMKGFPNKKDRKLTKFLEIEEYQAN